MTCQTASNLDINISYSLALIQVCSFQWRNPDWFYLFLSLVPVLGPFLLQVKDNKEKMGSDLSKQLHQNAVVWKTFRKAVLNMLIPIPKNLELYQRCEKWESMGRSIFQMKADIDKTKPFQNMTCGPIYLKPFRKKQKKCIPYKKLCIHLFLCN